MAKIKYIIDSHHIISTEVYPIWDGVITYKKENNDIFFRAKAKKTLTFYGLDFQLLQTVPETELIKIEVHRECNGSFSRFVTFQFMLVDCQFDLDKCKITVLPDTLDEYLCYEKDIEKDINFYDMGGELSFLPFSGKYEIKICTHQGTTSSPIFIPITNCVNSNEWWVEGVPVQSEYLNSNNILYKTVWSRIVSEGFNGQPPPFGSGWVGLGNNLWRKKPDTILDSTIIRCNYGRNFNDMLTYFFSRLTCPLTVVSDFFKINPDGSAPSNLAYEYASNHLRGLQIHQKSDVKRPLDSNKSKREVWNMKPKLFLDDLRTLFNVHFTVTDNVIRLEHLTYFEINNIVPTNKVASKNQYQYDGVDNIPTAEIWQFQDKSVNSFGFYYSVFNKPKKEYNCNYFTNDLPFLQNINNKEVANDAGFVLAETQIGSNGYAYLVNANEGLMFKNLLYNLHYVGRFESTAKLGYNYAAGHVVSFDKWKKLKKQPPFAIPQCCDADIDLYSQYETGLGIGEVSTADYNMTKDFLELNLKY